MTFKEEVIKLINAEKEILEEFKEAVLEIPIANYARHGYRYKVLAILLEIYNKDLKEKKEEQNERRIKR